MAHDCIVIDDQYPVDGRHCLSRFRERTFGALLLSLGKQCEFNGKA